MSIGEQLDLAFNPLEPRDSRGRWTRFGGVAEAADVAMKEREGFSASPRTGQPPAGGYMVAQTGHTHTFPVEILDDHAKLTRAIDTMLMSEHQAFAGKQTYLGGWVHGGKLWVEPSDNIASKDDAVAAGRGRNQIAVWDVAGGQEIQTGGTGGGRITEHDATGAALRSYDEGAPGSSAELSGAARGRAAGSRGEDRLRDPGGIAAQLDLTGDGHGHHIPGTPDVYRHGYIPVNGAPVTSIPAGEEMHGYDEPDPVRLHSTRSPYADPADHPFFKANPVSAGNVVKSYDSATDQEKAQGMRWYADAKTVASAIAGGDSVKGGGVLSAYSPKTAWPANMFNAARALQTGKALGPGDGMITRVMQKNAQVIMDGGTLDQGLKSPKTNAFGHLIATGADDPDDHLGRVVVDRHALSVAVGRRMTKTDIDSSPIGDKRYYQHVADTYRNAARQISQRDGHEMTPHQLQAVTWIHQQNTNQAEDSAVGGSRLQRGRTTNTKNQWAAWEKYEQAHDIPVVSGTTALTAEQVAEALEMAQEMLDAGAEPGEIEWPFEIELTGTYDAAQTISAQIGDGA